MSRRRGRGGARKKGRAEKYTRAEGPDRSAAERNADGLLDRNEVERQNALQASEAADRAAAVVEGEVQAIMEHAEAGADEVRRNAERDAHHLREEAAATGSRVVERVEALAGALTEHAEELRREVDGLHAPSGGQRET